MTERLFTLTLGKHKLIILKSRVNDASFVGIHRLQGYGTSCSLYLVGDVLCKHLQCLFSSLTIILGIKLHADILLAVLIDYETYKVLQRIQCLTSFSDEHAHLFTGQADFNRLLVLVVIDVYGNIHIHLFEYLL